MKLLSRLVKAIAVVGMPLVGLPSALAFYLTRRNHATATARARRKELPTTVQFLRKPRARGGYSYMPPLANHTLPDGNSILDNHTLPKGNIFKVFRRDVYPTIDLPYDNGYSIIDHYFMGMALQQAKRARDMGEVPIGALIVRELAKNGTEDSSHVTQQSTRTFQIISAAHNRVETNVDASAHAELLALRKCAQNLRNWRSLPNSRLYSTLEPCPMCLASIQAFRVDHIVYGAPDNRLGAVKTHMDLLSVAKHPYHEVKSVTGGVREEECGDIMVQFFRERRRKKKKAAKGGPSGLKLQLKRRPSDDNQGQSRIRRFVKALFWRE